MRYEDGGLAVSWAEPHALGGWHALRKDNASVLPNVETKPLHVRIATHNWKRRTTRWTLNPGSTGLRISCWRRRLAQLIRAGVDGFVGCLSASNYRVLTSAPAATA